jgi:hypothetical protein
MVGRVKTRHFGEKLPLCPLSRHELAPPLARFVALVRPVTRAECCVVTTGW